MIEPDELAALLCLPRRAQALWLGSRRATDAQLENQGPLDLMIWLDGKSRQIRTGMITPRTQGPDAMLMSLKQAMLDPAANLKPGLPARVAVEDEVSRAYLVQHLGPLKVEVVAWEPSKVLEEAFANMEGTLSRGPGATYLDKIDDSPELIGRMFGLAARLFELAPWEGRTDIEPVRILGLKPSPLFVSLLGDDGNEYGLAIYLTVAAARAVLRSADPAIMSRHPVLFLSFTHPDDAGPGILMEASEHGWKLVDAECLPLLARTDRPADFVAHGEDVTLANDVMEALLLAMEDDAVKVGPLHLEDGRKIEVTWPAIP